MPKKPVEALRVPLNCLIAPATKEALTGIQNETKESQGEVIDRAIALMAFGEEVKAISSKSRNSIITTPASPESVQREISEPLSDWRSNRKPLLKPSEKKK